MDSYAAKSYLSAYGVEDAVKAVAKVRYHHSYRALLHLGQQTQDDDQDLALMGLSAAVYSWMPTILRKVKCAAFNSDTPVSAIRQIDSAAAAQDFVANMAHCAPLNDSWIGTSKLMHMINPAFFPIWDRKVAARFNISTHYRTSKKTSYAAFLEFIHCNLDDYKHLTTAVGQYIHDAHGYRPTDVRCVELLLFADK